MNEGARRGFKWAALISLGASVMEIIYCTIAFTGFARFFTEVHVKAVMEWFTFFFMIGLGIRFLLIKSVPAHGTIGEKIETRLHPHSAFMIGFVRVMGNLGVLLFWIVLAASFIDRGWVQPDWTGKGCCVLGVALGTSLWFFILSWGAALGHKRFSDKTLLRMARGSGIGLLVLGLAHGIQIIYEYVHHQPLGG
jgi:threonine/homoserine/homoserine lactone efflux protein